MGVNRTPFAEFAEALRSMTPAKKLALIEAHRSFVRLRSLCEARGWVKTLPTLSGITVYKNTPEVKELKKVIDVLQPGRFKWIDETKKKSVNQKTP